MINGTTMRSAHSMYVWADILVVQTKTCSLAGWITHTAIARRFVGTARAKFCVNGTVKWDNAICFHECWQAT